MAIDNALDKKPSSFDELLKLLQQSGYEINYRGKSITLKASDWKKSVRLNSTGYTIDNPFSIQMVSLNFLTALVLPQKFLNFLSHCKLTALHII